jgi:hypothetical protein
MAASWEELEQKYSGGAAGPAPGSDPWGALEEKYGAPVAQKAEKADKPSGKVAEQRPEATLLERGMAVPAGINRGVTNILGLPVDTLQNAIDLGKAGVGSLALLAGRPDLAPDVSSDRSGVIGSSDWISKNINKGAAAIGVSSPINNPRPDDLPSRLAYTAGMFAGSSINPNPQAKIGPAQQAINMGTGAVSGLLAGATNEVAPEWAGLAAMAPAVAAKMVAGGTKLAVRGGEEGRKRMEQRIQDLKAGGVDEPSVGLASGNKTVMGLENVMAQTPFSSEMYQARGQQNIAGMQRKTNQIRDAISPEYGPVVAGSAVQRDLKGAFKERIGKTYGLLNDRVEAAVGPDTPVPVTETLARTKQLTTPIKGAEATSNLLMQSRIKNIQEAMQADAGGRPAQTVYIGGNAVQIPTGHHGSKVVQQPGLLGANGAPLTRVIPATQPAGLPFSALKDLRTKIGKESQSNAIMGTPEQAEFKQLYGAMSQDMKNAVALADVRSGRLPASGGSATTALNRANTYYSRGMERVDDLGSLANRSTPEGAYNSVANSLNAGPTLYKKLRGAVTTDARQKVVATVVDEMGSATPGRQNAAGDVWSPQTFLTNFNKLDGKTRTELFKRLPGGVNHGKALDDVAKAAEMVGDASKIWANPSGTAPALTARGTFYALSAGAFLHPLGAATTAGGLALGNQASKRLLLNPKFVHWLAKAPTVKPEQVQIHAQRLSNLSKMTSDKQFQQDVIDYLQLVQDSSEE